MPDSNNPYRAPSEDEAYRADRAYRGDSFQLIEGGTLVAPKGAVLPPICLWNGERCSAGRRETNFAWAPWWTLIFIGSPVLYLIVYFLVRKRGLLSYCLGAQARRRRELTTKLLVGGVVVAVALVAIGVSSHVPLIIGVTCVAFIAVLITSVVLAPSIKVVRIDEHNVHVKLRPEAASAFPRAIG